MLILKFQKNNQMCSNKKGAWLLFFSIIKKSLIFSENEQQNWIPRIKKRLKAYITCLWSDNIKISKNNQLCNTKKKGVAPKIFSQGQKIWDFFLVSMWTNINTLVKKLDCYIRFPGRVNILTGLNHLHQDSFKT